MNTENIEYESLQDLELLQLLRRAAETSRRPEEPNRFPFGGPHGGEEGRGPHGPHGGEEGRGPHGGEEGRGHHGPHGPEHRPPHRERERVLSLLDETEGISQQKLALILGIRPQSLSELIMKLERDGLLLRSKNPEDRRETLVSLTEAGRQRAAEFEQQRRRREEDFLAPLTAEERSTLTGLLRKLLRGGELPEEN